MEEGLRGHLVPQRVFKRDGICPGDLDASFGTRALHQQVRIMPFHSRTALAAWREPANRKAASLERVCACMTGQASSIRVTRACMQHFPGSGPDLMLHTCTWLAAFPISNSLFPPVRHKLSGDSLTLGSKFHCRLAFEWSTLTGKKVLYVKGENGNVNDANHHLRLQIGGT
jgi:hypothetical protein